MFDPKTGAERLLIDPETLASPGQPPLRVSGISPSPDGRYVAFRGRGIGRSRLYILETASVQLIGKPVDNILDFTGLDWDPDSKSVFIVKLPPLRLGMPASDALLNSTVYRHTVGTDQTKDQLILAQGENAGLAMKPTYWAFVYPTADGKFLSAWIEDGSRRGHGFFVAPRAEVLAGKATWKKIADFEDDVIKAAIHGNEVFLVAEGRDSKTRLLRATLSQSFSEAKVVGLPTGGALISDIRTASDALYVTARKGSSGALFRVTYDGVAREVKLPVDGMVQPLLASATTPGGLFRITGWTRPALIYRYVPDEGWRDSRLQVSTGLEKDLKLIAESAAVRSHDGVSVPLTLVYRRGLRRDSSNPVYMIGYGSYGATLDPGFDNSFVPWFEAGGILAFAHTRGGGELGTWWHLAGSKEKKRNTWLDFIACAQYLIDQKYTRPARLAGGGLSAGGILIGRSITERPELFAAALISVATTDMLRAEFQMNGPANVVEFGTTKEKTGFEHLYEMSSYHHVKQGVRYPAVLVSAGMKDTNVDVWQSAKMAAKLQNVGRSERPVLLRVDPEAGHDQYGSTRAQIRELRADQITFLLWQLGILTPGNSSKERASENFISAKTVLSKSEFDRK